MTGKQEAKRTVSLAIPIILGEMVQMALHVIDSAMVGAIGHKQLAASSLVFGIINIPFVFAIGMTVAIAQMISFYKGKMNSQKISHYYFNGMVLSVLLSIIIGLSLYFSSDLVFHLKQDAEVAALAKPFMRIMSLSMIPMILFIASKQFTDGLEYTKIAMVISIIGVPLNIFINWLLIFGNWGFPRLELNGAAYGTLITRILMFLAITVDIFKSKLFKRYIQLIKRQWFLSRESWKELLHLGVPISLQTSLEASAFAISSILVGMISAKAQAAHQIALSLASFVYMGSIGLGQACSIRISNAYGQNDRLKIRTIGKSTMVTAIIYGLITATLLIAFKDKLPLLFNKNLDVIHLASWLLVMAAIFQIPDTTQVIAAGSLRGIRDVKIPTLLIGSAYWVVGMPIGIYLAFESSMQASGIWLGFIISLIAVSIALISRFFNKTRKDNWVSQKETSKN